MIYQPPNKKNTSISSNSDLKNIDQILNDDRLSNNSLNLTSKDLVIITEDIKYNNDSFDDIKNCNQ